MNADKIAEALRVLTDACEAEYCSPDTDGEGDDEKVAFPEEACNITFGMIRKARAALAEHDAQPAQADKTLIVNMDQAAAWRAVADALTEVAPGWLRGDGTGMECAVATIKRLAQPAQASQQDKRWPFVESPGEFTERLRKAMQDCPLIGAVRQVLIENPPKLAQAAQPVALLHCVGSDSRHGIGLSRGSMSEWDKLLADQRVLNDGVPVYLRQQPVGVPDGRVTVPRGPTNDMVLAGIGAWSSQHANAIDIWHAMLAAAPQPPAQPSADAEVSNEMVLRAVHASLDWPHPLTHFEARKALEAAMAQESDAARAEEGGE